jgi:hypothetical protein
VARRVQRERTYPPSATIAEVDHHRLRRQLERRLAAVINGKQTHFGLVRQVLGRSRIADKPPLVRHFSERALSAHHAFESYANELQEERRVLLRRYRLQDVALKVVGVGRVGTFCALGLFVSGAGHPLLLQIKEARESVLAPFAGASDYTYEGERVVVGQRMMQAATDVFLGWTQAPIGGRHFYLRRLKDPRHADGGARIEAALPFYATLCGRALARAHARGGNAAAIGAYLGGGTVFDHAIADFAMAYADQTERDWHQFRAVIDAGRITAEDG